MFGLKKLVVGGPSVKWIELTLVPADDSFMGDRHEEVDVHGYDVNTSDGRVLSLSRSGPVAAGVFYFRLDGSTNHPGSERLDVPAELVLRQKQDKPTDSPAIEVLDRGEVVGYVPAELVPKMVPVLSTSLDRGCLVTGTTGLSVKTFHRQGRVVGCEVLAVADGYGIEVSI